MPAEFFTILALLLNSVSGTPTTRTLYFLYNNAKSWNDAKMMCERNSQTLLMEKTLMVAEAIARFKTDPEWDMYLSGHDNWIGLQRQYDNLSAPAVWHDCSGVGHFSNWGQFQPEIEGMCVATDWVTGKWTFTPCDRPLPFICQKPAGNCPFDVHRAKKFPDTTSGLFNTTTEAGCQELCRRVAIGNLECWAATFYRANYSCYLHLSDMPFQGRAQLQNEIMADVYFKNCFKAFINTYSIALNYTSPKPLQGCWIDNTVTTDVTSASSMESTVSLIESSILELSSHIEEGLSFSTDSGYLPLTTSVMEESTAPMFVETLTDQLPSSMFESSIASTPRVILTTRLDTDSVQTFDSTKVSTSPSPSIPEAVFSVVTTNSNGSVVCWCPCSFPRPEDLTSEEMEERVEEIVREIKVDKQNLSSTQRKFISVTDQRTSAQGIGAIGVAILCGVFGGIMALDLVTVCSDMWQVWQNFRGCAHNATQSKQAEEIFLQSFTEEQSVNVKTIFDTN